MNTTRQPFNDQHGSPVSSLGRNRVDHLQANSGASECVRTPDRGPDANAPAQGGVDGPVLPRAAAPGLHREGAAKQEETHAAEPSTSARPADRAERASVHRPKRRRRDDENPMLAKVSFRVSPETKQEIERRAASENLTVAHYLARKALTDADPGPGGRDESLDEAIDELRLVRRQSAGAASNLNQLARDYNSGIDLLPAAVRDAADAVRAAFDAGRLVIADIDRVAMELAKAKHR
ncbi:hypothetical protein K353_04179 [Kitasatospora sp. SolWspMP-SS2h]|uniref:plasmid mobilization protein n=1 Tax=Kitasatospora sp. SolWspMP-SS2h TaxID=1305729 RepID=UPI000DBFE992|nr:hypothetical protein [Kitasatospora sp. SolWspMP-SS2h]RAJ38624.1 hypothetical protein K353_04179 [Kitasatospora sp. SolWspMP-SS2h]